MGASQEDATEGGGRTCRLGKVLSRGDKCGVVVWGVDLGVVVSNGSEARESSCGITETGVEVEYKMFEGWFVAECGDIKRSSGSRDTTTPDLIGQDTDNSGRMGGLTAYI